jgi:hypothetical protein
MADWIQRYSAALDVLVYRASRFGAYLARIHDS